MLGFRLATRAMIVGKGSNSFHGFDDKSDRF
jgi:hypothetical protein